MVWDFDQSGNIAIGDYAGVYEQNGEYINGQDASGVAIGFHAGQKQGRHSVAIGSFAGVDQSANTIILNATGVNLSSNGQNRFFVKPIRNVSQSNTLYYDDKTGEITYDVSGGSSTLPSGTTRSQYLYWETSSSSWKVDGDQIHIGSNAGEKQASNSIAIGKNAGEKQVSNSIAIGENAGKNQGDSPYFGVSDMIAIGGNAGLMQGLGCVALGGSAGTYQTSQDIAIGLSAGQNQGGTTAVLPGRGGNNIAIGCRAGTTQNKTCIAIGFDSGYKQGDNCIAIGYRSGTSYPVATSNQADNSIIFNATGNFYNAANSGFFVRPITNAPQANALYYNDATGEITYDVSNNSRGATTGSMIAASILTGNAGGAGGEPFNYTINGHTGPDLFDKFSYIVNRGDNNRTNKAARIEINSPTGSDIVRICAKFTIGNSANSKLYVGLTKERFDPSKPTNAKGTNIVEFTNVIKCTQFGIPFTLGDTEVDVVNCYFDLESKDFQKSSEIFYLVCFSYNDTTDIFVGIYNSTPPLQSTPPTREGAPVIMEAYSIPSGIYQNNNL